MGRKEGGKEKREMAEGGYGTKREERSLKSGWEEWIQEGEIGK